MKAKEIQTNETEIIKKKTEDNKKKYEEVEGRGASDAVPPSRDGTGCHPTEDNYY